MMVLNALYFHDDWKIKFNKTRTKLEPFYLSNSTETKVNLMYLSIKNANYIGNNQFQAIKLFYNTSKVSATIVLPAKNININNFILNMDTKFFFSIFHNIKTEEVELYLPRIKLENSFNLNKILNELGLKEAFKESADFSALTDFKPIYFDTVLQKLFLKWMKKELLQLL